MVGPQPLGVGAAGHRVEHLVDGLDAVLFKLVGHTGEDFRQHARIVAGAVMVERAQLIVVAQRIKGVARQTAVEVARKRNGVEICIVEPHPVPLAHRTDEADVEVGVVRDEHAVLGKIQKRLHRLRLRRGVGDRFVGDARSVGRCSRGWACRG